jgi:hypothetical protein
MTYTQALRIGLDKSATKCPLGSQGPARPRRESHDGGTAMRGYKSAARIVLAVAVPLAFLIGGGCAPTINHAYDHSTDFAPLRTYSWAPGAAIQSQNGLVEANVQFLADPILEKKGFTKATGKGDFVITVTLENYPFGNQEGYELAMLSLNVYRPDGQMLIWRGTALGSISTDSASADLTNAVQRILAAFPPR